MRRTELWRYYKLEDDLVFRQKGSDLEFNVNKQWKSIKNYTGVVFHGEPISETEAFQLIAQQR